MENIVSLLKDGSSIKKKYEIIAEKTGSNFNIFNILDIESDEVKHSKFIAELISSKGLHNQGALFFKLFLESLKNQNHILASCKVIDNIGQVNYSVLVEEDIGEVNLEKGIGGRLDIVIKGEDNSIIVIENKINAKDQSKQLRRYKNKYPNSLLLYLSKDGKVASLDSADDLKSDKNYFCISYKNLIIEWVEKCIIKVINKPFIRENLTQYLQTIKSLTNQSETMEQSIEIQNTILKDANNFIAAKEIAGEFENAKIKLFEDFWDEVLKEVKEVNPKLICEFHNVKQQKCALFINSNNEDKRYGIEPLNDWFFSNKETFIGIFINSQLKYDEDSKKKLNIDFRDINKTLGEILPNTPTRKKIITQIVEKIVAFIKEKNI